MNDCEKCRDPKAWPPESVTLPGGIAATLCNRCRRAFVLRVLSSELTDRSIGLAALRDHYRDLALARTPATLAERITLQRESDEFTLELAEASVAWLDSEHGGGAGASEWPQAGSIPAPDGLGCLSEPRKGR